MDFYRRLRPRFVLDLLVYTPDEFDRLIDGLADEISVLDGYYILAQ